MEIWKLSKELFFLPQAGSLGLDLNKFLIVLQHLACYLDCHLPNVVYLITCSRWSLQFVGKTGHEMNERFNGMKHVS